MSPLRRRLRRALELPLVVLAALLFLFEDFLWAWLDRLLQRLARLPAVAWLEARIRRLPPYPAMALFLVPVALLVPVHLVAVYLVARGKFVAALGLYAVVKLAGTAMLARLFVLCRPALMSLAWFRRLYAWVMRTKERLYAQLEAIPAWQRTRRVLQRIRASMGAGALRAKAEALRRRWRRA
jgi:hypothetical protein